MARIGESSFCISARKWASAASRLGCRVRASSAEEIIRLFSLFLCPSASYSRPMRSSLLLIFMALSSTAQTIGMDTHIDTAQRLLVEGVDLTQRLKDGMADLPRLHEGGMNAPFFSLWVPTYYKGSEAVRR